MSGRECDIWKNGLPIASMFVGILSFVIFLFTVGNLWLIIALDILAIVLAVLSLRKKWGVKWFAGIGLVLGILCLVICGLIIFSWNASGILSGIA